MIDRGNKPPKGLMVNDLDHFPYAHQRVRYVYERTRNAGERVRKILRKNETNL